MENTINKTIGEIVAEDYHFAAISKNMESIFAAMAIGHCLMFVPQKTSILWT
ncbi:hypothetical protein [Marinoscillum luteum]|uniref:Uncharacterized protein n=1 Tax=Marinoscillum luteum TaxID=861051 RepID=A0ABW7NDK2_9BACT